MTGNPKLFIDVFVWALLPKQYNPNSARLTRRLIRRFSWRKLAFHYSYSFRAMLETSLLSIRIKVLIFHVIYLFVFVLWHYTQQEDFFDHCIH